jgi:predicted amidohydrolase
MKICVAQTRPVKGEVERNIEGHKKLVELAISSGADIIIFPELSLTGYEPTLADDLATNIEDTRLNELQVISDAKEVTIGVGMPIKTEAGICIGMILFQPGVARQLYSKKYLHSDEEPFFIAGINPIACISSKRSIALAICYELLVPEHAENAARIGAQMYVASVAKTKKGVNEAARRLSHIAREYSMTVLMSNCVGLCDGDECAGMTAVWDSKGLLIAQLNETDEGFIIVDADTGETIERII